MSIDDLRTFAQRNIDRLSLLLELRPGATLPAERIRQFVGEVAPGVPVDAIEPLSARYAANGHQSHFLTFLVSVFAAIGLLLAVVGTYATASHALSRRIRELGIRIALGAGTASVFRLVLSRALAIAAVGIGAGLVLTLGLTRFLESYVFGITARDPNTFGVAAAVIGTCAALASLGPAVRADPNEVLRSE